MSGYSRKQRRMQAAEQAAGWLMALQSDQLSSQERGEFIDWLRESPLHIAELLHAARLHRDLSKFSGWADIEALKDWNRQQVVSVLPTAKPQYGPLGFLDGLRPRAALLVSLLVVAIAGLVALSVTVAERITWTTISTQPGERREVTLADGSIVNLAPDSELRVRLETKQRLIWLDRGEALFNVEKNPRRPFIAAAANTRVRAVGTSFDVSRRPQGVAVTVVEGRVRVTATAPVGERLQLGGGAATNLSLSANEQIVISPLTGSAQPVRQINGEAEVAWATGQLIFDNQSVAEVASRFNRYNSTQIRVLDPALASRRVSGTFRVSDPESFVAFIKSVAGEGTAQPQGGAGIALVAPSASAQAAGTTTH